MPKISVYLPSILLFALAIHAGHALALEEKDCGDVRLDQGHAPFAQIPVYDQRALGESTDSAICYAITASQLIDAKRFYQEGKLPKQLSAPLSLAALSIEAQIKWNTLEGMPFAGPVQLLAMGSTLETIKAARQNPVCDQNWLNQFDGSFGLTRQELKTLVGRESNLRLYPSKRSFLEAIHAEIKKYQDTPLPFLAGLRGGKQDPVISEEFFECRVSENVLPLKPLIEAIKAAAVMTGPVSSLGIFMKNFCSGHSFPINIPEPKTANRMKLWPPRGGNLSEYRVEQLEKIAAQKLGEGPVGVQYCATVQRKDERGSFDRASINDAKNGLLDYDCTAHASVIVGRRFRQETQSCELLVRDSFGPDCEEPSGNPKYSWECENGQFWIDSKQLMKSAFQLTWL